MKQTNYFPLVIIVVIVVLVGGAFWWNASQQPVPAPAVNNSSSTSPAPAPIASSTITYRNSQYGFAVVLPASWQGYSVVTTQWTGRNVTSTTQPDIHGPIISIRHPLWTAANPRQDIPIMIFTPPQWGLVTAEEMSLGAAPIPPSKLGSNNKYVFALPARYNYAFPTGWQEVDAIVKGNSLTTFNI